MSENCGSCRFWKARASIKGLCRRYAPRGPAVFPDARAQADAFPATDFSDWCGEYQPLPTGETG